MKMNYENRRVIIYGYNKYQRDFQYVFDNINVDYYIDDVADGDIIKDIGVLQKEQKSEIYIIICAADNMDILEKLAEYGFVYKQDFCLAQDLFYMLNYLNMAAKSRKLAIWGTGYISQAICEDFDKLYPNIHDYIYIDNNIQKSGDSFHDRRIFHPTQISDWRDYYIMIATDHYYELKEQLENYGLNETADFISYKTAMNDNAGLMTLTYFDKPKTAVVCEKPFGFCDLDNDNIFLCCPGFQDFSAGSILYNSFEELWNSMRAKIIRLSIINGTYSFCKLDRCFKVLEESSATEESVIGHYSITQEQLPKVFVNSIDYSCNLHCSFCRKEIMFSKGEERKEKIVIADKFLDQILPSVDQVWMCGNGEIFFSKVYQYILDDDRFKKDSITILTNGLLLHSTQWLTLKNKFKHINVSISIDAATKEVYEKLRQGGDFTLLLSNLKYMSEKRKNGEIQHLSINFILSKINFNDLYLLIGLAKEFHIDRIKIQKFINYMFDMDYFYNDISLHDRDSVMLNEYKEKLLQLIKENNILDYTAFEKDLCMEYKGPWKDNKYMIGIL